MLLKNTTARFGSVAIFLHWVIAILIIGLIMVGLYMVGLPNNFQKLKLFGWHKEFGILVLMLAVVRILWRLSNITPVLALLWLEKIAARTVHWAFYFFMFAMPLTGWLMSSAAGLQVSFFGWVLLPDLIAPNVASFELLKTIHQWLGYALIVTIVLHTSAALKHHFINKDDILRRIFP